MRTSVPGSYRKGLGDIFSAFASGPRRAAEAQAQQDFLQSRIGANMARIYKAKQEMELARLEDQTRRDAMANLPTNLAGVSPARGNMLAEFMDTGTFTQPQQPGFEGPPAPAGPPEWATDEVINRYKRGMALQSILPSVSSSNPYQVAQAMGQFQRQDLLGDMMAGARAPADVAPMVGAMEGKPLYGTGSFGPYNLYGGALANSALMRAATAEKAVEAQRAQQEQQLLNAMLAGTQQPANVGRAMAAMGGDPLYGSGQYGTYDKFGGELTDEAIFRQKAEEMATGGGAGQDPAQVKFIKFLESRGVPPDDALAIATQGNPMTAIVSLARIIQQAQGPFSEVEPGEIMEQAVALYKEMRSQATTGLAPPGPGARSTEAPGVMPPPLPPGFRVMQ